MEPIKTRTPDSILFFGPGPRVDSVRTMRARCACVAIRINSVAIIYTRDHTVMCGMGKSESNSE